MTTTAPAFVSVPLAKVENELSRQLAELRIDDEPLLARPRLSNLLIFCNSRAEIDNVVELLPHLVELHPARVLMLLCEPGAASGSVSASVKVMSIASGKGHATCSEQVLLEAAGPTGDRLPFAVRELLLGDLPTNLWWHAPIPPSEGGPLLVELTELCQQIIYDSNGWPDPVRGVASTATWVTQVEEAEKPRWCVLSDINWRRLKYWRRLLAQALDSASAPGAAESITELTLEHGPHAVVRAWMLAGWCANRLGWSVESGKVHSKSELSWRFRHRNGKEVTVRIQRRDEGTALIQDIRIFCTVAGEATTLHITRVGEHRLSIAHEGRDTEPRTITFTSPSLAELIGRQLCDRVRDPILHETLATTRTMAQRLASS